MSNNQLIMPEGYLDSNIYEVLHFVRERKQIVPATILSISYPDDTPTWVLNFRDYPNFTGLVPAEQTGVEEHLIARFMGQNINVHIVGIDKENNYLACSRKSVVELMEKQVKDNLKQNSVITAVIKAILPRYKDEPSQVVVDIGGGVLTSIPSGQAKLKLSQRLDEQLIVGQAVKVKVLNADEPIEVSIKEAAPSPWETKVFNRGQYISGTILNIANNIVFIEPDLAPGMVGIAPVPLLGSIIRKDRVSCFVVNCDNENKKLKLNIKSRII